MYWEVLKFNSEIDSSKAKIEKLCTKEVKRCLQILRFVYRARLRMCTSKHNWSRKKWLVPPSTLILGIFDIVLNEKVWSCSLWNLFPADYHLLLLARRSFILLFSEKVDISDKSMEVNGSTSKYRWYKRSLKFLCRLCRSLLKRQNLVLIYLVILFQ